MARRRRPPEHLRLQRLPHVGRRPAPAVVDPARPASCRPVDVWTWTQLGRAVHRADHATRCTPSTRTSRGTSPTVMSGAADDWAYEHLGVYSWTTEFWDVDRRGHGPALAHRHLGTPARRRSRSWPCSAGRTSTTPVRCSSTWHPFDHPQLGPVELGGWDWLHSWTNPPSGRLQDEVAPARRVRGLPGARRAGPRGAAGRRRAAGRGHVAGAGRHRQHRLAADDGHRAGPRQRASSSRRWSS